MIITDTDTMDGHFVTGHFGPGHFGAFHFSLVVRKPFFAYAKTKTQISFAVTAKLISAFVFATRIVQSLFFLNPNFQASSHVLWLYSPVCVGPGRKPRKLVFSQRGSFQTWLRGYKTLIMLNSGEHEIHPAH